MVTVESEEIETRTDKSHCCCKVIRIKHGTLAVAVIYAFIIVTNLGIRLYKSAEVAWNWQLLFLVSDSASVLCLFYGVARHHPAFLQPFTVVSIITISFCALLTVFYTCAIFYPKSYMGEDIEMLLAELQWFSEKMKDNSKEGLSQKNVIVMVAAGSAVVYACTVIVHSWFMIVVVRCARYFKNQKELSSDTPDSSEPTLDAQWECLLEERLPTAMDLATSPVDIEVVENGETKF